MPQQFPAIRLVALDLDGTLLNREGHVTPRTRAALQAAVDKGVYIVPATGRPLASLPPEVAHYDTSAVCHDVLGFLVPVFKNI